MFDLLSDRLSKALQGFSGKKRLTKANLDAGLRDIKLALLDANTSLDAVNGFVETVKKTVLGEDIVAGTSATQTFIKRIHEGLVRLLSAGDDASRTPELALLEPNRTTSVMLSGLQGSGKTTLAGKLALRYKTQRDILLVSLDVHRPAADEQLQQLAQSAGVAHFDRQGERSPKTVIKGALSHAKRHSKTLVFFDTAGRVDVDPEMMKELQLCFKHVEPSQSLYVCDAMAGQRALQVAKTFGEAIRLDALCFTKADADTQGGAVLSTAFVLDLPIKFLGTGEALQDLDTFDPKRMADRLLGRGDVVGFVERAEQALEGKSMDLARKPASAFDLGDMLQQLKQLEKVGSVESLLKYLPGSQKTLQGAQWNPEEMVRMRSVIESMTPKERQKPFLLSGSRKQRIAKGSGRTVLDVNKVLKKFSDMKNLMQKMKNPSTMKTLMKKRLGSGVDLSGLGL